MVNEDAGELIPDGAVSQRRGCGGVDPAGERADGTARAHGVADRRHLRLDERRHRPLRPASAHIVEKVLEHLGAPRSVGDLGMELHPKLLKPAVGHGRDGIVVGAGQDGEPLRRRHDGVAVAHPAHQPRFQPGE